MIIVRWMGSVSALSSICAPPRNDKAPPRCGGYPRGRFRQRSLRIRIACAKALWHRAPMPAPRPRCCRQTGRGSCRDRGGTYVVHAVVAGYLKKQKTEDITIKITKYK